jgi:hypothetical protein
MKSRTAEQLATYAQNALDAFTSIGVDVIPIGPPPKEDGWFCANDVKYMKRNTAKLKLNAMVQNEQMEMKKFKVGAHIVSYYREVK